MVVRAQMLLEEFYPHLVKLLRVYIQLVMLWLEALVLFMLGQVALWDLLSHMVS